MKKEIDGLHRLARLALAGPANKEGLREAAAILRQATGATGAAVVYAEEQEFLYCCDQESEAGAVLTVPGLAVVQRHVTELAGPVGFNMEGTFVKDFAAGGEGREYLAFTVPMSEGLSEMCILRGPWGAAQRLPGVRRFMESAMPALTMLFERFLNANRSRRHRDQLAALANVAQMLVRSHDIEGALTDLATAIAASTGFDYVSIDIYDAAAQRFLLRVLSKGRWSESPLAQIWKRALNADNPEAVFVEAVTSKQPIILADLRNDPRLPEVVRQFFRRALLASAGFFPMLFQDEPLGVMAFVSYKPRTFPEEEVRFLQDFATEGASALKAMRTHRELVESRERLQRYAQRIERQQVELRKRAGRLRQMATTDALTRVRNYGYLHRAADRLLARAQRSGKPLAVILADVDDFKLYNDTYGHLAGDGALREVARALASGCRPSDIVGRYGGDEFMLILPDTDRRGAWAVAERLLDQVGRLQLQPEPDAGTIPLDLAIGIAVYPDDGETKDDLIAHADAALYESKSRPRSERRITLAHEDSEDELVRYPTSAFGVLDALVRTVDRKDHYTKRHSEREAELAVMIGEALGLSAQSQRALRIAGLLHDLGKIGIPDRVLRKPGPLTEAEHQMMRQHVILTERIVGGVPHLADVLAAAANHHERFDGSGYPRGLKGEEIPLLGRILAVADAYSAMTMDRPYRKALSRAAAIRELRRQAGSQFDPAIVELFIQEVLPRVDGERARAA